VAALAAVIFDYGGVLRGGDHAEFDEVDRAAGLPRGSLWSAYHDIPEYRLSRLGAIDADAFRAAVRRALVPVAGEPGRAESALAALDEYLAALPAIEPDMRALLGRLRAARRVRLGLLSNAARGFTERLRGRGVAELFDQVIVSGDVGLAKPDPAVFRLMAERLGVEPAACLMVDDQPEHLASAERVGLRTHLFRRGAAADLLAELEAAGALS
jgi:putative hydrolase of the HAD superfamily